MGKIIRNLDSSEKTIDIVTSSYENGYTNCLSGEELLNINNYINPLFDFKAFNEAVRKSIDLLQDLQNKNKRRRKININFNM